MPVTLGVVKEKIAWKDLLLEGLGGGAVHGIVDGFLKGMFGTQAIMGIGMKDVVLIFLGKYGAERTTGWMRSCLRGMSVIAIYKAVYPTFVEPMIKGIVPAVTGAGAGAPPTTTAGKSPAVLTAEQKYGKTFMTVGAY